MPECLSANEIDGFVQGTLDAACNSRVHAHLSECVACRDLVAARAAEIDPSDAPTVAHDTKTRAATGSSAAEVGGVKLIFPPPTPRRITGYEILSKLHEGGQGIVYKAVQQSTQRVVAIKVLRRGSDATLQQRQRFEREVKLSANLKHPHIVTIYESGPTSDGDYLAMEYIDGQTLDEYVLSKDLERDDVLRLFAKVADAVDFAHRQNVMHRDLKPGNILVDAQGKPCVLDFGLAKAADHAALDGDALTMTSDFMGTPAYASPEQIRGDHARVDTRSDIYSLGVILYRLLTREYPYQVTQDLAATYKNIAEADPVPPSRIDPNLGTAIDTVLLQALAKDPDRRYQTAGDLAQDLQRLVRGEAVSARRDNPVYVLRTRCNAFAKKHRFTTSAIIALVATLFVQGIGVELLFKWTPLNAAFERFVTANAAPTNPADTFESVRVIGMTEQTDMQEIAATEGLSGVVNGNKKSFRRLHGRLMKKLAAAGADVVGWDIKFEDRTEFDADFVKGVTALRKADANVVVGVRTWQLDDDGRPPVSSVMLPSVWWGCVTAYFDRVAPWRVQLAMKRGLGDPGPSLALAMFAAYRHPLHRSAIRFDPDERSLHLLYFKPDAMVPHAGKKLDADDRVPLTAIRAERESSIDFGIEQGDLVAHYEFGMPANDALSASTIEYGRVFEADDSQLRAWFAKMAVLVGDLHDGVDRHPHPDGRKLAGVHGHAAALDTLLRGRSIRVPRPIETYAFTLAAAIAGVVTVVRTTRRPWRRSGVSLGLVLCAVVASVLTYRMTRLMINPSVPIVAFVVAGVIASLLPLTPKSSPISVLSRRHTQ